MSFGIGIKLKIGYCDKNCTLIRQMLLKTSATNISVCTLEAGNRHPLLEALMEMLKVLINVMNVYCRFTVALARLIIHRIIIPWHEFMYCTCHI